MVCTGCDIDKSKPYVKLPSFFNVRSDNEGNWNYHIVNIDGCEYIYIPQGNATVMSHKGNCSNVIHRCQYQLKIDKKK